MEGQLMLKDRKSAGEMLAKKLVELDLERPLVLAIPRGGAVLGYEVAKVLRCDLDIATPRKLRAPDDPELAIGAVMPDGSTFINETVVSARKITVQYIGIEKKIQAKEAERRLRSYRGTRKYPDLKKRNVILADDGIATGATMMVAARWARKQSAASVTIAIPVIPEETLRALETEADRIIYLAIPPLFFAIGQFYRNFEQVKDSEVAALLNSYWNRK